MDEYDFQLCDLGRWEIRRTVSFPVDLVFRNRYKKLTKSRCFQTAFTVEVRVGFRSGLARATTGRTPGGLESKEAGLT